MNDEAFFERAILASAADTDDLDAVRQLRGLFGRQEMEEWAAAKRAAYQIRVPVGHDEPGDFYWAKWGGFAVEGASPDSYEGALADLAAKVRVWAEDIIGSRSGFGEPAEVLDLAGSLLSMTEEGLFASLLVRVSFDHGSLEFRLAEFVEADGTASQRAVPFFDGEPPAEVDLTVRGRSVTYQANVRGDGVIFSPVGFAPSIVDTLRQEDPTGDFDAEFPRPELRPRRREF